jgi:hypothetical protein
MWDWITRRFATRPDLFLSTPFRVSFLKHEVEGLRVPVGRVKSLIKNRFRISIPRHLHSSADNRTARQSIEKNLGTHP